MLSALIDWSAKNRFLVLLGTLAAILGGIHALLKTPLDALPDLSDAGRFPANGKPGDASWQGMTAADQAAHRQTVQHCSIYSTARAPCARHGQSPSIS